MATTNLAKPTSFDRTLASARSTMMFSEVVRLAVDSFHASKIRFLLTMLGMIIGSASIILVATLGLTGKQYALNQLSSIGPNKIEMQYNGGTVIGPDNTSTPDFMTRDDMHAVLEQVPGIVASSPMLEFHDNVSMGGGITKRHMMLGVSPQYKEVRNLVVVAGRFFDDQDASSPTTKVAVIVEPFARALYRQPQRRGRPEPSPSAASPSSSSVSSGEHRHLRPVRDQHHRPSSSPTRSPATSPAPTHVKEIFFTMSDAVHGDAAPRIAFSRSSRAGTAPAPSTPPQPSPSFSAVMAQIADMLTIVLTLGAAITLIVSGVGIMNSMLANVQSRISEIGIRKALGATSREIRLQFLTEAVFLSLSGGIVGTVLGLAIPLSVGLPDALQDPGQSMVRGHLRCDLGARRRPLRNAPGEPRRPPRPRPDPQVRVIAAALAPVVHNKKTHQPRQRSPRQMRLSVCCRCS